MRRLQAFTAAKLMATTLGLAAGLLGQDSEPAEKQEKPEKSEEARPEGPAPQEKVADKKAEKREKSEKTYRRAVNEPEKVIRIFRLKYLPVELRGKEALSILSGMGNIAIDSRTNSLIVQATPEKLDQIASYLTQIDQPAEQAARPEPKRAGAKGLRVVWLLQGQEGIRRDPPADLKDVTAELGKLGVDGLGLVAQVFIRTNADGKFTLSSRPQLDEKSPVRLEVSGMIQSRDVEAPDVELQLQATRLGQEQDKTLCNFSSIITTPPGHPVVLCVSPIGTQTSVFVVQLVDPPGGK